MCIYDCLPPGMLPGLPELDVGVKAEVTLVLRGSAGGSRVARTTCRRAVGGAAYENRGSGHFRSTRQGQSQ